MFSLFGVCFYSFYQDIYDFNLSFIIKEKTKTIYIKKEKLSKDNLIIARKIRPKPVSMVAL